MSKLDKLIAKFRTDPPEVRFEDVKYVLEAIGFYEERSKGSHHIFCNARGVTFPVPKVGGRMVKRIYVRRVLQLLEEEGYGKG